MGMNLRVTPNPFQLATRAQASLTGGGNKSVLGPSTYSISWDERFIAISQHRGPSGMTSGYFEIVLPPNGTVIPNVSGGSAQTVVGGRIPMPSWGALWYILPMGGTRDSRPENFRITQYDVSDFEVPEDWVLVCQTSGHVRSSSHRWGTGELDDYWKIPTMSWVNYSTPPYESAGYRKLGNLVQLKGLVRNPTSQTGPINNALIFTLPAGFRPSAQLLYPALTWTGSALVNGRLDVQVAGSVILQTGGASWVSVDGVSFQSVN